MAKALMRKNFFTGAPEARRILLPYPIVVALLALGLWLVLRLVLWRQVASAADMNFSQAAIAFLVGAWFDLAALAYLVVPILVVGALLPNRLRTHRLAFALRWIALTLMTGTLLFGAVSEFVFWDEFTTRFNFIAVDYLIYTNEVIGNIRQSYPVGLIVAGIGLAALALVWLVSRRVGFSGDPLSPRQRAILVGLAVGLPVASFQLANVDQMSGAGNEHALELSGNGLFSLAAAMRRNELDYDRFYRTIPQEDADRALARLGVARKPLSGGMPAATPASPGEKAMPESGSPSPAALGPFSRRPRNVVMVSVESLSADFLDSYGGTRGLTPHLDRLAGEGLKFERVFATGTRTVRGLEALSLGTPPIPGQAIVRRPGNEHLATVGQLAKDQGMQPFFIYGGYGYFDNMNAYFAANDYHVVDRTDFPKESIPFENIWGVADESLFANALRILDGAHVGQKPFFAQIMTTSNHRPFTYPQGRIDIASPGGREGAVKYTDYAIGKFIEDARKKPWFADTLFVIVADHCASVAGKTKLPVANYRIPLIFYAPDMLKPGTYPRMISQIDIAPTLVTLMGLKGAENFFGAPVFARNEPTRALISNYQELGYYKDDTLIVLSPKQKVEAFRIDRTTYAAVPTEVDAALAEEAIAYYQSGARAFKTGALRNPGYR